MKVELTAAPLFSNISFTRSVRMRTKLLCTVALVSFAASSFQNSVCAQDGDPKETLTSALGSLDHWLRQGPNAGGWSSYLMLKDLAAELGKGKSANREVVARVLQQFE